MTTMQPKPQTLLSNRIPRDSEHERYDPELEEELKECLFCLRRNAMMPTNSAIATPAARDRKSVV